MKVLFALTLFGSIALAACSEMPENTRKIFDSAEEAYRAGSYEKSRALYDEFLKRNPDPQLARLSERRILAIEREIECVLGRKSGAKPVYTMSDDTDGHDRYKRFLYE